MRLLILLLVCSWCWSVDVPAGGRELVPIDPAGWRFVGGPGSDFSLAREGDVPLMRVRTTVATDFWTTQVFADGAEPINDGDTCLLRVRLRTVATRNEQGEAKAVIYVQKATADWDKPLQRRVSVGARWTDILMPFAMRGTYAAGSWQVGIGLGDAGDQTIEIGQISLLSYGRTLKPSELPGTTATYAGRELDAPWRAEADRRIDQLRKGSLRVAVVDQAGRPVSGASVQVRMQRHAFAFGTAVNAGRIMGSKPDDERYRALLKELFTCVVTENDLKWQAVDGEWGAGVNRTQTVAALRWLREQGFGIRGHVMVWPSWRNTPKHLRKLEQQPAELHRAICAHIDDVGAMTAGLCDDWDVVNEPYDNHDITDILGRASLADWFRRARAATHPATRLYLNDYGILSAGGRTDTPHQQHYEDTIRFLIAQGAPLDGIGMQGHFGWDLPSPPTMLRILDRYAALGKRIKVTEFDVNVTDEALQADFTRDALTVLFSHPSVDGFLMWGFWAGAHWLPDGAMFRQDWSPKPNAQVWRDLLFTRWWTNADGTTDAAGAIELRAFHGDYAITVSQGAQQTTSKAVVRPGSNHVTVTLP